MGRKLNINGTMRVLDEETFGPDETRTSNFAESLALNNNQLETIVEETLGAGGEVRGELEIRAQLASQNRIRVWVDTRLYEGTSEGTSDLDGEKSFNFLVLPGQTINKVYTVYNEAENCDDFVKVRFTCKNLQA